MTDSSDAWCCRLQALQSSGLAARMQPPACIEARQTPPHAAKTLSVMPRHTEHAPATGLDDARPALGEVWRVQAHQRLLLRCQPGGGRARSATLAGSSLQACGNCAWLQLTSGGFEPAQG